MSKPFTILSSALIIGIMLSYKLIIPIGVQIIALAVIFALCLYNIKNRKVNNVNIFLLFIVVGILITQVHKNNKLSKFIGSRNDYIGKVVEIIKTSDTESKYVVLVESQANNVIQEKISLKALGNKHLGLGDRIEFNGILNLPLENTNPLLYNHKLNLLTSKIYATMTIKDYSITQIVKNSELKYTLKTKFRNNVEEIFKTHLNEKNSKLITGIILGKSSYLEEEDLIKYRELGLAHILAVSGLHIGIISGFLLFIISRLGVRRELNYIITLAIIWSFGYLIGFSPSTLRSIIMFSILFYSMTIHEPYDPVNTIFSAIFVLLLANPFWLFNLSFQLSFIATLSIVILTPRIRTVIYPYKGKLVLSIASILAVNIGLLPIQAYYFNQLSLLALVSNLITIPILSLSLILGIIMILINSVLPLLNYVIGFLLNILLSIELLISNTIYRIPINIIKVFSPDIIVIFLYYILVGIVFKLIDLNVFNIKIKKLIIYYLLIFILINSISLAFEEKLEINFIDVGQGDSILIKTTNKNYLIDTGGSILDGFDVGKNITLPYLQKQGIFKLESVFITHFDEDHSKALGVLIDNIKINNIYSSYLPDKYPNIPVKVLNESQYIYLDRDVHMEVLWPDNNADIGNLSSNNKSLVLLLRYKNTSILFTGDIERETEEIVLNSINGPIDILKVAHHGSDTSSTEIFLNKVSPKNSIISVGRNNFYDHPNANVLERLNNIDSKIYRTDEMGMIKVLIRDGTMEITPFLRDKVYDYSIIFKGIYYFLYFIISYLLVIMYKRTIEGLDKIEL